MNADPLAPIYRFVEYAAFGPLLQHCRCFFLPQLTGARRALLLGEGDGRFLQQLLQSNPAVQVDVVEQSPAMVSQARRRISPADAPRVRFLPIDARNLPHPGPSYDLVVTHFFIDCLTTPQMLHLARNVTLAMLPDAVWIVSEFQLPERGWAHWHAKAWIAAMYSFFRWSTGLNVRTIPPYKTTLQSLGLVCRQRNLWRWGLLAAERYTRCAVPIS